MILTPCPHDPINGGQEATERGQRADAIRQYDSDAPVTWESNATMLALGTKVDYNFNLIKNSMNKIPPISPIPYFIPHISVYMR